MNWIFPLIIVVLVVSSCRADGAETTSAGLFAVNADLPAELVHDVILALNLPSGVFYRCGSLLINGEPAAVTESVRGANDGAGETTVTWSLDQFDNRQDQDIRLEFDLVAADIAQNQAGTKIAPCQAVLRWKDNMGVIHTVSGQSNEIVIVEPDLILERRIDTDESEDAVVWLSFYHSRDSSAAAHEVELVEDPGPGQTYILGSMKVLSGPPVETSISDSGVLKWSFAEVDSSWTKSQKVEVKYSSSAAPAANDTEPVSSCAALTYTSALGDSLEERIYSQSACSVQPAIEQEADLKINIDAEPDCVYPGGLVNYTIRYECSATNASGVVVQEHYDPLLNFISALPAPDSGTADRWTLGSLSSGEVGEIKIAVEVNRSAPASQELENEVEIDSDGAMEAYASCTVLVQGPVSLVLEQEASSDLLSPGGSLNYTLTVSNRGSEVAENVSIEDILDANLILDPQSGSAPEPSAIWQDAEGFHLSWDAESLDAQELSPGESRSVLLQVSLPSSGIAEELITNSCSFSSDRASGEAESLETFVVRSIFVRKKADRVSSSRGRQINYTIFYGNEGQVSATDAVLSDVLPEEAEYVGADPTPNLVQGRVLVWNLGTLNAHSRGSIELQARIKEQPDMIYWEEKRISGLGFVSSSQKLSTSRGPPSAVNYANITAICNESEVKDSSFAQILLEDAAGTELQASEHGSGQLDREQTLDYHSGLGLIAVEDRLSASFLPADGGAIDFAWPWGWQLTAANRFRDEDMHESGQYVQQMNVRRSLLMDKNQTTYSCQNRITEGKTEWGFASEAGGATNLYEGYVGDVSGRRFLDSYGRGVRYARESSGQGFSSWDKKISGVAGGSVSSTGHGSGSFAFVEESSNEPTLSENMMLDHARFSQSFGSLTANYSSKWSHALAVQNSAQQSAMGVDVKYADFLRHESLADSSTLSWSGSFAGLGSIEASVNGSSLPQEVELEESFVGQYQMDVALGVHDIPRFLGPHLSVSKRACWGDEKTIRFRINVTNNGNRTLAPVEVIDMLPEGCLFKTRPYVPRSMAGI